MSPASPSPIFASKLFNRSRASFKKVQIDNRSARISGFSEASKLKESEAEKAIGSGFEGLTGTGQQEGPTSAQRASLRVSSRTRAETENPFMS